MKKKKVKVNKKTAFHKKGMKAFKDYYPVEECAFPEMFLCQQCGTLDGRMKLIECRDTYLYNIIIVECVCGKRIEFMA